MVYFSVFETESMVCISIITLNAHNDRSIEPSRLSVREYFYSDTTLQLFIFLQTFSFNHSSLAIFAVEVEHCITFDGK